MPRSFNPSLIVFLATFPHLPRHDNTLRFPAAPAPGFTDSLLIVSLHVVCAISRVIQFYTYKYLRFSVNTLAPVCR